MTDAEESELSIASEAESAKLRSLRHAGSLCKAAGTNNVQRVTELLNKGVDPNVGDYDCRTALHIASSEGHLEIVKQLLAKGANPNSQDRWGGTPLTDAVRYQHTEVSELLKAHGASLSQPHISSELSSKLLQLVASRQHAAAKELLNAAPDPVAIANSHDYDHRTPLHVAASEGSLECVEILLKAGSHLNPVDRWGGTPLTDALRHHHTKVADFLKSAGAVVPEPDLDPILASVLSLFSRLLQQKEVKTENKKEIILIFDSIIQTHPNQVARLVSKYPPSQKKNLKKLLKEHYPEVEDVEFEDFVTQIVQRQLTLVEK
eukprot:TRINITY_DN2552_c0_g1_i1.p1 TRINITY_DN2552_c0_g1~~TRINITY_DN2552_c0_g1_i1.p1  ORF type:complete len:319 (-),score=83.59 TRINITY_DN2552_c0_g1_i1:36-992(-)